MCVNSRKYDNHTPLDQERNRTIVNGRNLRILEIEFTMYYIKHDGFHHER